jgi:hypothetical protein
MEPTRTPYARHITSSAVRSRGARPAVVGHFGSRQARSRSAEVGGYHGKPDTALIGALVFRPELSTVRLFEAGVEPENLAALQCLLAAGFRSIQAEPDYEGLLNVMFQR